MNAIEIDGMKKNIDIFFSISRFFLFPSERGDQTSEATKMRVLHTNTLKLSTSIYYLFEFFYHVYSLPNPK